jgi:hypothetical protein
LVGVIVAGYRWRKEGRPESYFAWLPIDMKDVLSLRTGFLWFVRSSAVGLRVDLDLHCPKGQQGAPRNITKRTSQNFISSDTRILISQTQSRPSSPISATEKNRYYTIHN